MTQADVRVRIAPSPTGVPHVGTAYIGLFNYVFARAHGGQFVIRIEDTDQTRSHRRYEEAILRSLRWVGLRWDEGPDVGGPYGPYRQSERLPLYQRYAQELIDAGAAYRCWCTPERLESVRQLQRQNKQMLRYDGHCRDLSAAALAAQQGEPGVVRLKVEDGGATVVHDAFREAITFDHQQIDDQVLLKSDGYPTYHLANVVDDHLMRISHVIRAEEWLSSTPKHVLLYQAFGWEPPVFMHMPLLRNADRSKISKRKNPVSLEYYERQGYLPETLLNFLALMGWSMPDDREIFRLDEMIETFSFDRVNLGGPVFDLQKLEWLNGVYIRQLSPEALAQRLQQHMTQPKARRLEDTAYLQAMLPLLQERLPTLGDFNAMAAFFYDTPLTYEKTLLVPKGRNPRNTAQMLAEVNDALQRYDGAWEDAALEGLIRT
ncbi:MAG: glutamate--tRNA ligase, partial [Candidatus Tectomicrobia bacterium]|nr:glutamate--tRNA ligase [Candidatus Tectomicrobia bacterium]